MFMLINVQLVPLILIYTGLGVKYLSTSWYPIYRASHQGTTRKFRAPLAASVGKPENISS